MGLALSIGAWVSHQWLCNSFFLLQHHLLSAAPHGGYLASWGTPPSVMEYLRVAMLCRLWALLWVAVVSSWLHWLYHACHLNGDGRLRHGDSEFKGSLAYAVSPKANGRKQRAEESKGDDLCSHLLDSPTPGRSRGSQAKFRCARSLESIGNTTPHLFSFPLTYEVLTKRALVILRQKAIVPP